MTGWSAPFAKRVIKSWKDHAERVGATAVAKRIRTAIETASDEPENEFHEKSNDVAGLTEDELKFIRSLPQHISVNQMFSRLEAWRKGKATAKYAVEEFTKEL